MSTDRVGERSDVRDDVAPRPVLAEETVFRGHVFDVVARQVDLGEAGIVTRDMVRHPGAVAIVALDDHGRVALLRQYRAPVGAYLWEVPAGLLDSPTEPLLAAAQRELAEEADLLADRWDVLVDYATTPGASDEVLRVFLARGLSKVPEGERFEREAEELGMELAWVQLEAAADAVLAGRIHNPSAAVGILAAARARMSGFTRLRAATAPWPLRPGQPVL